MMTDVRWPVTMSATRGAEGRRTGRRDRLRRAGKWCAAALAAGSVLALGAGHALAATSSHAGGLPPYWGEPIATSEASMPFVARESSGEVTFGLTGLEDSPSHVNKLDMVVFTPEHTRLVDTTLTPLDGAPGGWRCEMALGDTPKETGGDRMACTSDYVGPLPASGQAWRWKVKIAVPREFLCAWDKSTNGWAAVKAHSTDGSGFAWSRSMSMGIRTTALPVQAPASSDPFQAPQCATTAQPPAPAAPAQAPKPTAPVTDKPQTGGSAGLGGLGGLLGGLLPS